MPPVWVANRNIWADPALPYVIERHAELADLMPSGVLERFEVRRWGEILAIRFSLGEATRYAEERWALLDGRH